MLFIGGFGSHPNQAASVAKVLSDHYNQKVIGVSFSEAQKNLALVASISRECILITHSSGIVLCEDMTPKELIAIAPSVPTTIPLMAWRGTKKTISLVRSGNNSVVRRYKIRTYHRNAYEEHLLRPRYNSGQMAKICKFDPSELAVKMITRGVRVTLGFMDNDLLYPKAHNHAHVDIVKRHGGEVHENLKGHHDEFLLYPLDILAQLNRF